MDLATAVNHRNRLQKELDAMRADEAAFSIAPKLLAPEVHRLTQEINSIETLRFLTDDDSEDTISVVNHMMMLQLSMDFGLNLKDVASLEVFEAQLVTELATINRFRQPLPLTYKLTLRVMELVTQEISKLTPNSPNKKSRPRTRFYHEELDKSIDNAINAVIERHNEEATIDHVLDILRQNSRIVVDDYARETACQRFFEASFAVGSKPAPEE